MASVLPEVSFIWVTPDNLVDPFDVTRLFSLARFVSPALLWLEDLDLAGGSDRRDGHQKTLGALLNALDGYRENKGLVVVATTNQPEVLDTATTRAGRFDVKLELPAPNTQGRLQLLQVATSKFSLGEDVDLQDVADCTSGFTASAVREVAYHAALVAADTLRLNGKGGGLVLIQEHFLKALDTMKQKQTKIIGFGDKVKVEAHRNGAW